MLPLEVNLSIPVSIPKFAKPVTIIPVETTTANSPYWLGPKILGAKIKNMPPKIAFTIVPTRTTDISFAVLVKMSFLISPTTAI